MEGEAIEIQAEGNHMELENKKGETVSVKGKSAGDSKSRKKRKQREFFPPALDRPARERKSIDRLVISPDKEIKEFKIPKGAGTAFKDIPNIVFKLSKRRASDEVVQSLHKVLFGKTAKQYFAKTNILQFSGYVWSGNEEKEKAKIKERLERCIKESLFQISDILDLNLSKSMKKEDGVLKVLEFLESPHKTSDELFEENAKVKKSKKAKKTPVKGSKKKASGKTPEKSLKGAKKTTRKKQTSDEEDGSDAADFEKDVEEEPEEEKSDDDYAEKLTSSKKRRREPTKKQSLQESGDEEETLPKKKKSIKEVKKEKKKPIKEAKKERKPRAKAEKLKEPSEEDLQAAICELLQNADFSKVTFTDAMKQLSEKFKVDLTHRKSHLKALIQEEIAKLVGEGDNEDEDGNEEGENDDEEKVDGEQEEQEDVSGDDRTRDDEDEDQDGDGDDNAGDGNGDDEDGDGEKAEAEDEDEDANSIENKADGGDEDEDAKDEHDGDAEAEEDSTDMA